MASLTAAAAMHQPAQQHELVILDDFRGSHSHGELVEQVLKGTSECAVGNAREMRRLSVDLGSGLARLDQPGSLDAYVRNRFLTPIRATERALDQVSGRAVMHQSQGASESRIVESLWGRASGDAPFRADMAAQLGLPAETADRELLQALLDRVHAVHGESQITEARQDLLQAAQQAAGRGVIRVLSAGNQGELSRTFEKLDVRVPEGFYRSDLADPQAVIVGASDDRGTADPADDGVAALASPDAGALVGIDGVDRPACMGGQVHHHSGSSYAAPQVSRLLDEAWLHSPHASREELMARLQRNVRAVPGGEAHLGAGIVDAEGFLLAK